MYTVIDRKYHSVQNGISCFVMTIVVDAEADVPEPEESWMPGSICYIADAHKYLILNHKGEWK